MFKSILSERHKSRLQEFVFFSSGVLIFQFSRFGVNLLTAKTLGPDQFAPWNLMQSIMAYYALLTLGIPNAMNREVPFLIGSGKYQEAQKVADIAFTSLCILLLIGYVGCLNLPIYGFKGINWSTLLIFAILLPVWQLYAFAQILLKSRIEFKLMALQLILFGFLYPPVTFLGVRAFAFNGFLLSNVITCTFLIILIFFVSPIKVQWKVNHQEALRLAKIGGPILGAGLLFAIFVSTDRWLIIFLLGKRELGLYTLAAMATGLFALVPAIVSQQIYPRMAYQFGMSRDVRKLKRLMLIEISLTFTIMLPIVVLTYLAMPLLVERYMPAYAGGVSSARIILIGMLPLCFVSAFGSFLNTVNRQIWYMTAQFIGIAFNIILGATLVRLGMGLEGVATGTAISYLIYALCVIIMGIIIYKIMLKNTKISNITFLENH